MKPMNLSLAAMLASLAFGAASAAAQSPPDLSLTRFDCGKTTTLADVSRFSDVAAFKGLSIQLTFSCYLVKHGNDYLIWDTGNPPATGSARYPRIPNSRIENVTRAAMTGRSMKMRETFINQSGCESILPATA